jgi:hypothetical protein
MASKRAKGVGMKTNQSIAHHYCYHHENIEPSEKHSDILGGEGGGLVSTQTFIHLKCLVNFFVIDFAVFYKSKLFFFGLCVCLFGAQGKRRIDGDDTR